MKAILLVVTFGMLITLACKSSEQAPAGTTLSNAHTDQVGTVETTLTHGPGKFNPAQIFRLEDKRMGRISGNNGDDDQVLEWTLAKVWH